MTGLRIGRWFWFAVTLMLLAYGLHVALQMVPADAEQGNVGRILYYHVPTWVATCVCFLTNLAASLVYLGLRHRNSSAALRADALAVSSAEMGVVFCFLGLATGSLWGRAVWGVWWTWDARITTTLILWQIYVAYLPFAAIRGRRADANLGCGIGNLWVLRHSDRLYVYSMVAYAASRPSLLWRTQCRCC
jgi:ABC-type transport system involved in cytochrome c biogenesis permease subunit